MPRYLLKIDSTVSGPFSERALEEMASVRAFTEEALLAPEGTEAWTPLRELPELHARCFPARRRIGLKAHPFETVGQENNEPISIDKILQDNLAAEAKLPPKTWRRLPNRRRRDFLTAFLLLNGLFGGLWYFLPRAQATDVAFGSAAIGCSLGLYWLFYHIMDRY